MFFKDLIIRVERNDNSIIRVFFSLIGKLEVEEDIDEWIGGATNEDGLRLYGRVRNVYSLSTTSDLQSIDASIFTGMKILFSNLKPILACGFCVFTDNEADKNCFLIKGKRVPGINRFREANYQSMIHSNIYLALRKHATQSSIFRPGDPSLAVDGDIYSRLNYEKWSNNTGTIYIYLLLYMVSIYLESISQQYSCIVVSQTLKSSNPWWQVDLGDLVLIREVVIYKRDPDDYDDDLISFSVTIFGSFNDLQSDQYVASFSGTHMILNFDDIMGQIVKVQLHGENRILSLAEVKVHGSLQELYVPIGSMFNFPENKMINRIAVIQYQDDLSELQYESSQIVDISFTLRSLETSPEPLIVSIYFLSAHRLDAFN